MNSTCVVFFVPCTIHVQKKKMENATWLSVILSPIQTGTKTHSLRVLTPDLCHFLIKFPHIWHLIYPTCYFLYFSIIVICWFRVEKCVSGTSCARAEMVKQAQNSSLGILDVFIWEESSPKFQIYDKQRLMML